MQASDKHSLADIVFTGIRNDILSGILSPGTVLSEEHLAEQYKVSRTPIREALKRLGDYGLVIVNPRSNTTVFELTEAEAIDLANVRNALEQLALDSITPEKLARHLDTLSRCCANCMYYLSLGDRSQLLPEDSVFHQCLVAVAENHTLSEIYDKLDLKIQLLRMTQHPPTLDLIDYVNQHAKLIEYLRKNDIQMAKRLLSEHIIHDLEDISNNKFNT